MSATPPPAANAGAPPPRKSVPTLDWSRMREVYVRTGTLSDAQFEALADGAIRIHALKVMGDNWGVVHQILSVHREIPLLAHYEALCAGYGFTFRGVEAFHLDAIATGLAPAWSLNRTYFHGRPSPTLPVGKLMVELGLVDVKTVDRALETQKEVHRQFGIKLALGSVILSMGTLSYPDFYQALGLQAGIPYLGLDASAPAIFDTLGKLIRPTPPTSASTPAR